MAYFSQDDKKKIAPKIAEVLKKHGLKGSLSVRDNCMCVLTIKSGSIDFGENARQVNTRCTDRDFKGNEKAIAFFDEVIPVLNANNHDNSDSQSDYFDVGYYISINIGKYDAPYVLTK